MKRIEWAQRAIDDLLAIPDPAVACAVDAAVQLLAATGKGFLRLVGDEQRLYPHAVPYYVRLVVDAEAVHVWRVFRR